MRITLDTNFLISATLWDTSVAHKLLVRLIKNNTELFTTKEILTEFSEVLARDFKYSKEEIETRVQRILSIVQTIEPTYAIKAVKEDPDDDKILECAVASLSEYILTYDAHLLKLKEYENIKILTPEQASKTLN